MDEAKPRAAEPPDVFELSGKAEPFRKESGRAEIRLLHKERVHE